MMLAGKQSRLQIQIASTPVQRALLETHCNRCDPVGCYKSWQNMGGSNLHSRHGGQTFDGSSLCTRTQLRHLSPWSKLARGIIHGTICSMYPCPAPSEGLT